MLGPEDLPLGLPMILDVLFYGILVWMVVYVVQFFRRRPFPPKLFLMSLPLNAFLGVCLWSFYLIFSFRMGFQLIGRGHSESVYVETSQGIDSATVFAPAVSIPLEEVIEYYGDPDYVWLTSVSTPEGPRTGMLLYWDPVDVFVELPQIADETYPVRGKTAIERIVFYDDRDVIALAGQRIGEEKTAWTGYGSYQP